MKVIHFFNIFVVDNLFFTLFHVKQNWWYENYEIEFYILICNSFATAAYSREPLQ